MNSTSYNPVEDNEKFAESLAAVTADLKAKHITVLLTSDATTLTTSRTATTTTTTTVLVLTYRVKASLQELGTYSDATSAYESLKQQITDASSGANCTLEQRLQSSGGSFSEATVPAGSTPTFSAFEEIYLHTPVPSSQPSSSPSCPAGFNGLGCSPCPEGTYSLPGALECIDCPDGTYSDLPGSGSCTDCHWPWTSFEDGSRGCESIKLDFSVGNTLGTMSAVIVMYVAGISTVDKDNFSLLITSTFFPMLDTLSDYLNLITATWATEALFHLAWLSIFIPNVVLFVYELGKLKVQPRVFGWSYIQRLLWLRSIGGVPGYFDKPLLDIVFYDDFVKLLILWLCWSVSICAQGLCAIIAAFIYLPTVVFVIWMLFLGVVLFAIKLIT